MEGKEIIVFYHYLSLLIIICIYLNIVYVSHYMSLLSLFIVITITVTTTQTELAQFVELFNLSLFTFIYHYLSLFVIIY